jgi:hypothetical protein
MTGRRAALPQSNKVSDNSKPSDNPSRDQIRFNAKAGQEDGRIENQREVMAAGSVRRQQS